MANVRDQIEKGWLRGLAFALFGLLLWGVALADKQLTKPSTFTNPVKYLKSVPLGQVSVDGALGVLGIPDKQMEIGGKTYLTFEVGEGLGKRQFVYEFSDGKLTDVRFHQSGPYNGSKASELQGRTD